MTQDVRFDGQDRVQHVLPPAEQQRVADVLEHDTEVMSNTQLEELLAGQPRRSGTRSSASTPTRDRSPFRSRCSSRSSPVSPVCSPRGG
jgi:hypothetical protein